MFKFSPKSRLTVRAKSGTLLGVVITVEVDQATGRIATFLVAASRVLSVISDKSLAIDWSQVVDWQDDEIIVADAVESQAAVNIAVATPATPSVQMSEQQ
ncbi:MAG: PRC-barrel domain-containing protein [Patescibacteria group bacterium]